VTNTFATWNLVIASHAIAAALALVLAPVQLIRRHYGDPTHRLIGRVWAVQMLFTSAISFLIGGWADVSDWILRGLAVITWSASRWAFGTPGPAASTRTRGRWC